jgi:hypothetical protein
VQFRVLVSDGDLYALFFNIYCSRTGMVAFLL